MQKGHFKRMPKSVAKPIRAILKAIKGEFETTDNQLDKMDNSIAD
ncbi:hypothetical protein [Microbulbifer okhotskensis]|nr:hypothetical protein [Microbulbifer okhotskensis]